MSGTLIKYIYIFWQYHYLKGHQSFVLKGQSKLYPVAFQCQHTRAQHNMAHNCSKCHSLNNV